MSRRSELAFVIDRIRCDGRGLCAEMLPEVFALDDWGYPMLRTRAVPVELEALARRAVETCPVLALQLVRGDNPDHTSSRHTAQRDRDVARMVEARSRQRPYF
jgi:ferredoxin